MLLLLLLLCAQNLVRCVSRLPAYSANHASPFAEVHENWGPDFFTHTLLVYQSTSAKRTSMDKYAYHHVDGVLWTVCVYRDINPRATKT